MQTDYGADYGQGRRLDLALGHDIGKLFQSADVNTLLWRRPFFNDCGHCVGRTAMGDQLPADCRHPMQGHIENQRLLAGNQIIPVKIDGPVLQLPGNKPY